MTGGRPYVRDAAGSWAEGAACRAEVWRLVRGGWSFARAQHYVTSLFYIPGDGGKPGRPAEPRDDPWFLARLLCAACPVVAKCREHAIATHDDQGFRGGLTPAAITRAAKARRLHPGFDEPSLFDTRVT